MKKLIALVIVLVLAALPCAALAETIKIGVFEPASGDNGAGGRQEVLGIEYANSLAPTVEIDGTTYDVELVIVDNQSSTDKAVSAATELVGAGVSIVLGSYGSGVSMAGGDVFAAAGIPAIGCSCTNPSVTLLCDYYFRVCFLDPFQGKVMASFAADQYAAKNAYVLTQLGDDYSTGLGYYFKEAFEAMGGTVTEETFPEGNSDFSAYLNNAVNAGAEVIFCPSSTTSASLLINQAASMNLAIPLLAGDTWDSSVISEAAKGTNVEVCMSTFLCEGASEQADAFIAGFQAFLNADSEKLTNNGGNDVVSAVSALGYDAYMVAIEAIKAAGSTDGEAIREALKAVSYEGATGAIVFDENGDADKDTAYIKGVDNATGEFTFVKMQTVADLESK